MEGTVQIFRSMLKPDFVWEGFDDFETLSGLASEALSMRDIPQRIIGKIVLALNTDDPGTLEKFSKEIGVSIHTLRIYSWVEKRLEGIDFPEDLPWSALRLVAGTDDPKSWIDKLTEQGWSVAELRRKIMLASGKPERHHKHKTLKCSSCGFITDGVKCEGCGEVL